MEEAYLNEMRKKAGVLIKETLKNVDDETYIESYTKIKQAIDNSTSPHIDSQNEIDKIKIEDENIENKKQQYMREIDDLYKRAMQDEDLQLTSEQERQEYQSENRPSIPPKEKEIKERIKRKSIKLGVVIPNIRKKYNITKKELAIGTCAILASAGLLTYGIVQVVSNYQDNQMRKEKQNNYKWNVYDEYTNTWMADVEETYADEQGEIHKKTVKRPIHSHQMEDLLKRTFERYEDPIMAFYLFYNSLDDLCKSNSSEMKSILESFNELYGTTYTSYDNFLKQNEFKNSKELQEYIINEIKEQKERLGR